MDQIADWWVSNGCLGCLADPENPKTQNDPKFDLVTPSTLNSSKFEQNDLGNAENFTQENPVKIKFPNVT